MDTSVGWALALVAVVVAVWAGFLFLDILIHELRWLVREWCVSPMLVILARFALATVGGPLGGLGLLVAVVGIIAFVKANTAEERRLRKVRMESHPISSLFWR